MDNEIKELLKEAMDEGYDYEDLLELLDEVDEEFYNEDDEEELAIADAREQLIETMLYYVETLGGFEFTDDDYDTLIEDLTEKIEEMEPYLTNVSKAIYGELHEDKEDEEDEPKADEDGHIFFGKEEFLKILKDIMND